MKHIKNLIMLGLLMGGLQIESIEFPLHEAVRQDNLKEVKRLLTESWSCIWGCNKPEVDVNTRDNRGMTPLDWAAYHNRLNAAALLLQNKEIDVNARNVSGYTPLDRAVIFNHLNIASMLLNHEKIDVNAQDNEGWTSLHDAVIFNHFNIVALLLNHKKIDVNARNVWGYSPFYYADSEDTGKMLLQGGANIEGCNGKKRCIDKFHEWTRALAAEKAKTAAA